MRDILYQLAICSMTMSLAALMFILFSPFMTKRYGVKWQYYAWLIIAIGFIVPFRPHFGFTLFSSRHFLEDTVRPTMSLVIFNVAGTGGITEPSKVLPSITMYHIVCLIWLSGVVLVSGYHLLRHRRFIRLINRWSEDLNDMKALTILNQIKAELHLSNQVCPKRCDLINSPMMTGFIKPAILIPSAHFSENELNFIIRHELIHFKRKDMWYKCLVIIITAIHWFNPVVHVMAWRISELCELSCDAEVVKSSGVQTRQEYTEAIISTIQTQARLKTVFSTNFNGGKNSMKKRISSIMDTKKKKIGATIMCLAVVLILGTGILFAYNIPTAEASDNSSLQSSTDESVNNSPFEGWRDFLTYDKDLSIYRFNGKWMRTIYDEYKNDDLDNQFSRSISTTKINDTDLLKKYGEPVDLMTVRNPETGKVKCLVILTKKELEELRQEWASSNELEKAAQFSGGDN